MKLAWTVSRHSDSVEMPGVLTDSQEVTLTADNPNRKRLVEMLNNTNTSDPIIIPNILPKFLKVSTKGPTPISQLMMIGNKVIRDIIYGVWVIVVFYCGEFTK